MMVHAVWSAVRWIGLEHLTVNRDANGIRWDALVVALMEDTPLRVRYAIGCRSDWSVAWINRMQ